MINGNLDLSSLRLPSDDTPEEWRGRMRLVSADRTIPRRNQPLTEAERDAIEVWIPKGASILAFARGRLTREGCPVWVLSTQGALIMTLNDVGFDQIKARAEWLPASHLRRIDLDVDREFTLVRIVSASRRFVLYGIDRDSAVRFVAMTRAAIAAHAPPRGPRSAGGDSAP
jgi:hypothetical protein